MPLSCQHTFASTNQTDLRDDRLVHLLGVSSLLKFTALMFPCRSALCWNILKRAAEGSNTGSSSMTVCSYT